MPDEKEKAGPAPGANPTEKAPTGRRIQIPINHGKPPIDVKAEKVVVEPPKAPDNLSREVTDAINKAINKELVGVLPSYQAVTFILWPRDDGHVRMAMMSTYQKPQDVRQVLEEALKKLEGISLGGL